MTTDVWGVLVPTPNGVTVRFERRYATTPEDLWSSVTEPGASRALARTGLRRPRRRWPVRAADGRRRRRVAAERGRRRRSSATRRAGWWSGGSSRASRTSRVTVDIRPDGDGAVLVLEHLDLEEAAARGYGGGWHASLDQLDDHVAGPAGPGRGTTCSTAALPRYRSSVTPVSRPWPPCSPSAGPPRPRRP